MAAGTLCNFLHGIPRLLFVERLSWTETLAGMLQAIGFAFVLGFGCGAVVGILSPLSKRIGLRRSIVIGALGAPTIGLLFLLTFDPDLCQTEYLSRGFVFCIVTAILGGLLGAFLLTADVD